MFLTPAQIFWKVETMRRSPVTVSHGPENRVFICLDDMCDILQEVAATEETDVRNRLTELANNLKETQSAFVQNGQTSATVSVPSASIRYKEMIEAAEKYFNALKNGPSESETLQQLRDRLDKLQEPFSDDPAYVAFLRSQRG